MEHAEPQCAAVAEVAAAVRPAPGTVVAHMAGQNSVSASIADPRNDFDLNTYSASNIADPVIGMRIAAFSARAVPGSVTGSVMGSVMGSVGSVVSVGSVAGGFVTTGSVGVVGSVVGSVAGSVGSVGSVVGSVGDVVAALHRLSEAMRLTGENNP